MSEFLKTFETLGGITVEQVMAFAALIVPGFISLRVYEMRRGGEARKTSDVLFDLVIYSFATEVRSDPRHDFESVEPYAGPYRPRYYRCRRDRNVAGRPDDRRTAWRCGESLIGG